MTTTINASATNGLVTTADGSGIVKLQSNGVTTNALTWINFSGITVNTSYNISSVTKNATGYYTINFTNTLSDTNFILAGGLGGSASSWSGTSILSADNGRANATNKVNILTYNLSTAGAGQGALDYNNAALVIFGN